MKVISFKVPDDVYRILRQKNISFAIMFRNFAIDLAKKDNNFSMSAIITCECCKKVIPYGCVNWHHVDYEKGIQIPVCIPCHQLIHTSNHPDYVKYKPNNHRIFKPKITLDNFNPEMVK